MTGGRTDAGTPVDGLVSSPSDRAALLTLVGVLVVGFPLLLHLGRHQWFFLDEFDFLVHRDGGSFSDLMQPHNEHWSTFPILVYRALFNVVGLGSYLPYQALVVLAHLVAVALLWVVMRRSGVHAWIATALAAAFVVFGSGRQDIVWAFQIGFTGSLALGLGHLLLADHDGRLGRRDVIGLVLGLVAVMTSGIGVVTTVAVGGATLLRRGWKVALVHTVPLAAVYLLWLVGYGGDSYDDPQTAGDALARARDGFTAGVDAIGQVPGLGWLLGLGLVAGAVLAVRRFGPLAAARRAAAPIGLLLGCATFLLMTGLSRPVNGNDVPEASRYVYLVVALLLPALGFAIAQLFDARRIAGLVVLAAVLVGVPGNLRAFSPDGIERYTLGVEDLAEVAAREPLVLAMPADTPLFELFGGGITVGFLREQRRAGQLPAAHVSPARRAEIVLGLVMRQSAGPVEGRCAPLTGRTERTLPAGHHLWIRRGVLEVRLVLDGGPPSPPRRYRAADGAVLEALSGPLHVVLAPGRAGVQLCERAAP